jgi:hypothetical protein
MRKQIVLTVDEKVLRSMEKVKEETGTPISQMIQRAWVKVYESK